MSKAKDIEESSTSEEKPCCGIVMPISAIDGCPEHHWVEVRAILKDAIESTGFEAKLVSDADEVGIIQERIIQNLFDNPIVVCDVSGKNPNVMFELGMRLAFDKPTIIVKDDKTSYSFDTSPIEHVEYPRDLRFTKIVDFKKVLAEKVKATHAKATTDEKYTTFLGHFGKYTVAKLETTEISQADYIVEELKELKRIFSEFEGSVRRGARAPSQTEVYSDVDKIEFLESIRGDVEGYAKHLLVRNKIANDWEIIGYVITRYPKSYLMLNFEELKEFANESIKKVRLSK